MFSVASAPFYQQEQEHLNSLIWCKLLGMVGVQVDKSYYEDSRNVLPTYVLTFN